MPRIAAARVRQRVVREWRFDSARRRCPSGRDIEVDALFEHEGGESWRVPAYWCGGATWRARFAPPRPGRYHWRTSCTDPADAGLHHREGAFIARPYPGSNALLQHGGLRVAAGGRHLEHEDGTPFFWLADTWWNAMHRRLKWPRDFQGLARDRRAKGFTVAQFCVGLYPELDPFDPRCAGDGGPAWLKDFHSPNPAYYDGVDRRVGWLVEQEIVPCIVGAWGYHLLMLGAEGMRRHWRNLVARYGAWPVVWCLAGEGAMPYYLRRPEEKDRDSALQRAGWTDIARHVRQVDPWRRPITIHPRLTSREEVTDASVLDFIMLQTGHAGWRSAQGTVNAAAAEHAAEPTKPFLNAEVAYEGHQGGNWHDVQRFMFWTCVLNGACGHTYGAGGIWQANTRREPLGASVHHPPYENTPWDAAVALPGAAHLAEGKRLLTEYPWWRMQPHPEWVDPRWTAQNYTFGYAAGIPGELRMIYRPWRMWYWDGPLVRQMEPGAAYDAFYFDPVTGRRHKLGTARGDASGAWQAPPVPWAQDWLLVMTCRRSKRCAHSPRSR